MSLIPACKTERRFLNGSPALDRANFSAFPRSTSTIGLIRHIRTGHISPQFHIVFDERFETVASEHTIDLDEKWIDLFLNERDSYIEGHDESVGGPLPQLHPRWEDPEDPDDPIPKKTRSQRAEKFVHRQGTNEADDTPDTEDDVEINDQHDDTSQIDEEPRDQTPVHESVDQHPLLSPRGSNQRTRRE